jgi:hypothetical protein
LYVIVELEFRNVLCIGDILPYFASWPVFFDLDESSYLSISLNSDLLVFWPSGLLRAVSSLRLREAFVSISVCLQLSSLSIFRGQSFDCHFDRFPDASAHEIFVSSTVNDSPPSGENNIILPLIDSDVKLKLYVKLHGIDTLILNFFLLWFYIMGREVAAFCCSASSCQSSNSVQSSLLSWGDAFVLTTAVLWCQGKITRLTK